MIHWLNLKNILTQKRFLKIKYSTLLKKSWTLISNKVLPLDLACIARRAKVFDDSNLKILSPKHMLQRLPIALSQVKVGNTSENILNEIRQIIYSLFWAKEITKTVYNTIMNSIKL